MLRIGGLYFKEVLTFGQIFMAIEFTDFILVVVPVGGGAALDRLVSWLRTRRQASPDSPPASDKADIIRPTLPAKHP